MRHSARVGITGIICLAVLLGTLFVADWIRFLHTPIIPSYQSVDYILKPTTSVTVLASDLHKMGLLQRPFYFVILAKVDGLTHQLRTGEYRFAPGSTARQILKQMAEGKMLYHPILLLEGWTFQQIMKAIHQDPHIKNTLKNLSPKEIMNILGHPSENPEGRFFPDTYLFTTGTPDIAILRAAYKAMQKRLNDAWQRRELTVPYQHPYEALIVASLIEKETAFANERPRIAGVIVRRLQNKMPLQIDAAVIYGLGDSYKGKLAHSDLQKNTPYNTYLHRGLPPTPIAMPSEASIVAALHPEKGTEIYYVATGNGDQTFSTTLKEHQKAVQQLRQKIKMSDRPSFYSACGTSRGGMMNGNPFLMMNFPTLLPLIPQCAISPLFLLFPLMERSR